MAAGMVVAAATEVAEMTDWGARVLMKEAFAVVAACSGLAVMASVGCSAGTAMEAAAEEAPTPNMPPSQNFSLYHSSADRNSVGEPAPSSAVPLSTRHHQ